jgi:hypothetical protein
VLTSLASTEHPLHEVGVAEYHEYVEVFSLGTALSWSTHLKLFQNSLIIPPILCAHVISHEVSP